MNLLLPEVDDLVVCSNMDDLSSALAKCVSDLGFTWGTVTYGRERRTGVVDFTSIGTMPDGYETEYLNFDDQEPAMCWARDQSIPLVWNRSFYEKSNSINHWETMASYGMRSGLLTALHMPRGRHFIVGLDSSVDFWKDKGSLTGLVGRLQIFAVHAEAAFRRIQESETPTSKPALTQRELDCILWTSEGKTAWEVGMILKISERTVAKHIEAAVQKLGCSNKMHAAAHAIRIGLI